MPKQTLVLKNFEGGLNDHADPRDIADNELAKATDIYVDQIGILRSRATGLSAMSVNLGGGLGIASPGSGTGLSALNHDRTLGSIGLQNHITNGAFTSNDNDWSDGSGGSSIGSSLAHSTGTPHLGSAGYIHYAGGAVDGTKGYLHQAYGDLAVAVVSSATYYIKYTLSGINDQGSDLTIILKGGDGYIPASDIYLGNLGTGTGEMNLDPGNGTRFYGGHNGTYIHQFVADDSAATGALQFRVIDRASSQVFQITDIELYRADFPITGENYLLLSEASGSSRTWIYDPGNGGSGTWTNIFTLGGTSTPLTYSKDGDFRVVDASFNSSCTNKIFCYRNIKQFGNSSTVGYVYNSWLLENQEIAKPLGGYVKDGSSNNFTHNDSLPPSSDVTSDDAESSSDIIHRANLWVVDTGTTGFGLNKIWEFAMSFVYDKTQESPLYEFSDDSASNTIDFSASADEVDIQAGIVVSRHWAANWNKRITGINIYMREAGTTTYYLQSVVHMADGGEHQNTPGTKIPWVSDTDANQYSRLYCSLGNTSTGLLGSFNSTITYEASSGLSQSLTTTSAKFKTAVITNRRTYAGNIEYVDEDGNTQKKGDAMIKSPVDAFDTFSANRIIEAVVGDGDDIVKLEEYADRILQFKQSTMYLINISQDQEFLEETFVGKGISHTAASCKTDFGVAWVNKNGVYLYDGKAVNNLLEKGGQRKIKPSSWTSFTTATTDISYIPFARKLVVGKGCTASEVGDAYIFDMITQSWVYADTFYADNNLRSNTVRYVQNNTETIVHSRYTGSLNVLSSYKDGWDGTTVGNGDSASAIDFITKDIDFGEPAIRKKMYRVRISYKGDLTSLTLSYRVNGGPTDYYFEGIDSDGKPTGSQDTTPLYNHSSGAVNIDWKHAELRPATTSQANNIYSMQIRGTGSGHLYINDISIIFRAKGIK